MIPYRRTRMHTSTSTQQQTGERGTGEPKTETKNRNRKRDRADTNSGNVLRSVSENGNDSAGICGGQPPKFYAGKILRLRMPRAIFYNKNNFRHAKADFDI